MEAYIVWEASQEDPQDLAEALQAGIERAQAAAALRAPNENAVAPSRPADADLLAAYMAYINLEEVLPPSAPAAEPPPLSNACRRTWHWCMEVGVSADLRQLGRMTSEHCYMDLASCYVGRQPCLSGRHARAVWNHCACSRPRAGALEGGCLPARMRESSLLTRCKTFPGRRAASRRA